MHERITSNISSRSVLIGSLSALALSGALPSSARSIEQQSLAPTFHIEYSLDIPRPMVVLSNSATYYKKTSASLTVNKDGYTECKVDAQDELASLKESDMTLRIEKPSNHRWVRDTRFKEKTSKVATNEANNQASGIVAAHYNPRALADQNAQQKMRIVCVSDYIRTVNSLGKNSLKGLAQITFGHKA